MKRNFVIGLFGGLIGSAMLLMLLSAAGVVGARAIQSQPEVARTQEVSAVTPLTSTFTYQGQLKNGGNAVNGSCQMAFRLYDDPTASINLIGSPFTTTVPIANGLFTVGLNFGSNVFDGNTGRWLDIKVNCNNTGFVALTPRQALAPAPYALALPGLYTTQNITSPNIIGGYSGNTVAPGVFGAVIGGGGGNAFAEGWACPSCSNVVSATYATIGGGMANTISTTGNYATIDGGAFNTASKRYAIVGGGNGNTASGFNSFVGGGGCNIAGTPNYSNCTFGVNPGDQSTVAGGLSNHASGGYAFVGGGNNNTASGESSTVGGGSNNTASLLYATVGGGAYNTASGAGAFVGGGGFDEDTYMGNQALANASTIAGGYGNTITTTASYATIGGGYDNTASGSSSATVGGGASNTASGDNATVGGGWLNQATGFAGSVSGGSGDTASGSYATVGGGYGNIASSYAATIGGGDSNIASGKGAFVGGGGYDGSTSDGNEAHAKASTIAGGLGNTITTTASYAAIGGGQSNTASGNYATIPGGLSNSATMSYTFAAGRRANANYDGAFVWADSTDADFASTANDQFLIRANGGVGFGTDSPAAQLHVSSGGGDPKPQLRLSQTANDYVRLRLTNDNVSPSDGYDNRWDIATLSTTLLIYSRKYSQNVLQFTPGGANYLTLGNNAYVTPGGAWTNASDRNAKTNFTAIDAQDILQRVASLSIQGWNYTAEDPAVRHIGPMAQDFYAAFNVGQDNTHITTIDESGVALAAIQGLYQQNQELKAQIEALQNQNSQPAAFNLFNLLSVIAFGAVAVMWLQQRRSKRGES